MVHNTKLTKAERDTIIADLKKDIQPARPPRVPVEAQIQEWRPQFIAYRSEGYSWAQLVKIAAHDKIGIKTTKSSLARNLSSKQSGSSKSQMTTKERDSIFAEAAFGMEPERPPHKAIIARLREWAPQLRQLRVDGFSDEQIAKDIVSKLPIKIPATSRHIRQVLQTRRTKSPLSAKMTHQHGQRL